MHEVRILGPILGKLVLVANDDSRPCSSLRRYSNQNVNEHVVKLKSEASEEAPATTNKNFAGRPFSDLRARPHRKGRHRKEGDL